MAELDQHTITLALREGQCRREKSMDSQTKSWSDDWQSRDGCERILRVRWLLNPNQPPLENVEIVEQGGRISEIRTLPATATNVLPVVLTPMLVNAHTHLEFSDLTEPIRPALPFPEWISAVIQWRRGKDGTENDGVSRGLQESIRSGVGAIGEITTTQLVNHDDLTAGCQVVSFREIIGLQQQRIPELLQLATEHLAQVPTASLHNRVISGLSPHAPYTVHPELFNSLIELAVNHKAVVAMHLAETTDEIELLHNGTGRFVDFLKRLGLWNSSTFPGGRCIREFLEQLVRAPRALAIHGNYFSNDDIQFVARHANLATVYCPRTHAYFRHTPHPIRQLMAAGAKVVLGTDSRASNPDLSIWKELQFVATQFPDISIPQLLAMVTTDVADALGLPTDGYTIRVGGDLRCVMLEMGGDTNDLRQLVRHPTTQPVGYTVHSQK